jgi:tetratricopeptide (TPR) repeat protein
MSAEDRIEYARLLYERAVFGGDASALATADRELDGVEADLALARGRVIHTRFLGRRDEDPERPAEDPHELALFECAAKLYRELGDVRGEGEALFWVGCFHQVVRRDDDTAVPVLERSRKLAEQAGDKQTMSEALRHLGIAEHSAGRLDTARERLEESVRLRREIGLMPGVAANLVGLAYVAAGDGRHDEALALLEEAGAIAEARRACNCRKPLGRSRVRGARALVMQLSVPGCLSSPAQVRELHESGLDRPAEGRMPGMPRCTEAVPRAADPRMVSSF